MSGRALEGAESDEDNQMMNVNQMTNPATRCPLCGAANECGLAAGKSVCWCFSTMVSAEMLARVPEDQRGQVCLCPTCAAADTTSPDSPANPAPADVSAAGDHGK